MSTEKPFKPSISFLRKVEARQVYNAFSYSMKKGGTHSTKGGEKAIDAHAKAGLIKRPYIAELGRPSYAELTEAGRAVLDAHKASA